MNDRQDFTSINSNQPISRLDGPSRPCPSDFPEKIRPYWPQVQYSMTPIQSAWIQYYQDLEKVKRHTQKRGK